MRKLIYILLLFIPIITYSQPYYVATDGDDTGVGTIGDPWATWDTAMYKAEPGDTVFFRGGVYPSLNTNGGGIYYDPRTGTQGNDGTRANPIVYMAYPSEIPILDCSNVTISLSYSRAIRLNYVDFIEINGLHIKNVDQPSASNIGIGIDIAHCNNVTIRNMVIYNIEGIAYEFQTSDTLYIYNSDAYNCVDTISSLSGNNGVGFQATLNNSGSYVYFR